MRPREIASEQRHDRFAVTVQHGQPFARVPRREPALVLLRVQQSAKLRQAGLAQSGLVADRIGLEEILIGEAKADHPPRELDRIRHPGIARASVQLQQIASEIADHARGVVSPGLDHLDNVPDPPLEQLDQLPGRTGIDRCTELDHHRSRRARPLHAVAVVKEPARPQPAIDLSPQRPQIAAGPRRDQSHPPLDILMPLRGPGQHLAQLVRRELLDELIEADLGLGLGFARRHRD